MNSEPTNSENSKNSEDHRNREHPVNSEDAEDSGSERAWQALKREFSLREEAQRRHEEELLERRQEEAAEQSRLREKAKKASDAELQALINARIVSKRLGPNG